MECLLSATELRILGGLAFAFIILSVWVEQTAVKVDVNDFKRAGQALQLSGSAATVQIVIGGKESDVRKKLGEGLRRDFVFIFSYVALFVALGLLFSQANVSAAGWLGVAAAVVIIGAGAFDVIENYKSFAILALDKDRITDSLCQTLRTISTMKWVLLFLTVAFEAVILIKLMNWYSLIGVLMILSAVVGFASLRFHTLFTPALLSLGFAVIALGIILLAAPQKILRLIC